MPTPHLEPPPAALLTAPMLAHLLAGHRAVLARDVAELADMKRRRAGAESAPRAALLLRRIAAIQADIADIVGDA
jgi:hypothetical protein